MADAAAPPAHDFPLNQQRVSAAMYCPSAISASLLMGTKYCTLNDIYKATINLWQSQITLPSIGRSSLGASKTLQGSLWEMDFRLPST